MGLVRGGRGLRWRGGRLKAEWLVVALLSCGQYVNYNYLAPFAWTGQA